MWDEPIIVYRPVTYVTREYTTAGWVEVEWTEYAPFIEYPTEHSAGEFNMFTPMPPIKCGECGSLNVARTVNNEPFSIGRLVCLSCGHKGPEEIINFDTGVTSKSYTYTPPKEITF